MPTCSWPCIAPDACTRRREEGVAGLWTGVGPNIARNAIINAVELASYDTVRPLVAAPTRASITRAQLARSQCCHPRADTRIWPELPRLIGLYG